MDQKTFYEQQAGPLDLMTQDVNDALIRRDTFIVHCIAQALPDAEYIFTLLELSIGEGRLTELLFRTFPNMKWHGTDISPNRIRYVRRMMEAVPGLTRENHTFTECNLDTEFTLLESASQDFVIAMDILEHVLDVFAFVENCSRILKTNGLLLLRVPNIAYIKHRLRLLCGKLPVTASWFGPSEDLRAWKRRHGWDGGHLHLFTLPIVIQLLMDYGFQVESCKDPGARYEYLRNIRPHLLYANPLIVAKKA
jgi:cyclopropane fatty-acyl-phospholipid synthase-like methyltransferase